MVKAKERAERDAAAANKDADCERAAVRDSKADARQLAGERDKLQVGST